MKNFGLTVAGLLALGVVALAALVLAGHPGRVSAATYSVDSTGDGGDFSTTDGVCDTDESVGDDPCTLHALSNWVSIRVA